MVGIKQTILQTIIDGIKKVLGDIHLISTYLILISLVSGCVSRYDFVLEPTGERVRISNTHSEFLTLANSSDLPAMYVSEGKIGISKVEAALEVADAVDLQARAELDKQSACFSANRVEVEAQVSRNLSEANALSEKFNKEYAKSIAQIKAREVELEALLKRKDAIAESLRQECVSQFKDIIANGREKFKNEMAHIEQGKEIRNALEIGSNAQIAEMVDSSKATRERAAASILELDAKALSAKQEMQARVKELEGQINSTSVQAKSEANRLRALSEALLKSSAAHVKELRGKASTIGSNLAKGEYQLKLTEAASVKAETQAKIQEKSANASNRFKKAMAEIQLLRGEIQHHQNSSTANYESQLAEIQAKIDNELNEVSKFRSNADRIEQVARSEFIKVEAAARVEAVRQTAMYAESLAEAQKLHIIAESEAEAAKIKQEILDEIAAKKAGNNLKKENNTTEVSQQTDQLHKVPDVPQVQAVTARIEPEHIAKYRTSFAEVMRIMARANAYELVAEATAIEAKTSLLSIKEQEDAIASEQLTIADSLEAQARSRFSEIETKTEKEMDVVESKYHLQLVQAESFRKEKEAEVLDYQSQATAMEQISKARAQQLLAKAEAVEIYGKNNVKESETALWAVQQRGNAQHAKFVTESQSMSDSQEAIAMQIDAQIESARQQLAAELSNIDNSLVASERITHADYQQTLTHATVLRQKTDAEISRNNAQFVMEHAILEAQIERDKELALSQTLRGEAACNRMIADADTKKMCENAIIDAEYAAAKADMEIILTANRAKRQAAQGYLDAVKARFNARIQQVKSERIIGIAQDRNVMAAKRTDLASTLSQAMTAREDSNRKLVELKKRQTELQTASMTNWSDKLAMFK